MELPDYEILGPVGSGGMGLVYKARHLDLDRLTAIKILDGHWQKNKDLARRFQREARIAASMDHPNICTVYNYGTCSEGPFLAMSWCDGGSLKEMMAQQLPDPATALKIVTQVARGLAYAASQNIVHRDIKPGNIMFHQGVARIVDFGIARDLTPGSHTVTHGSPGTPAYMSPEQMDRLALDHRTDQWSLGVLFYQLLTGQLPFGGKEKSYESFCYDICFKKTRPVTELAPVPAQLGDILHRMLAKNRDHRFPSFTALVKALETLDLPQQSSTAAKMDAAASKPISQEEISVCLLYDHQREADLQLARNLATHLEGRYAILNDFHAGSWPGLPVGIEAIKKADYMVCLLSEQALRNEVFRADAAGVRQLTQTGGRPHMLPVKVRYTGPLHYPLGHFFDTTHQAIWMAESDTPGLARALSDVFSGVAPHLYYHSDALITESKPPLGRPPVPQAALETPSGTMDPESEFYIHRQADDEVANQLQNPKTSFTIHGPRQTGKSSLLMRAGLQARNMGKKVAFVDLQLLEKRILEDPDRFYRRFCVQVSKALGLKDHTEEYWEDGSNNISCTAYFEEYVLDEVKAPVLLAVDEADRLMETAYFEDFFGMLRSWLNNRFRGTNWARLGLALVTSTEAASLIDGVNQSPFNVGTWIYLEDFTAEQIAALNQLHGSPLQTDQLPSLIGYLGGHPYLIRRALYELARGRHTPESLMDATIQSNNPFLDHLQHYSRILRERPDLKNCFLQILKNDACIDEGCATSLEQIGLVRRSRNQYITRSALYQEFFSDRFS